MLSANVQDSIFEELGKSAEAEQNDYDLWYQLDNDGSVTYLDAFFQGDTSTAEMAVGTYRYSVTDTKGKTFYRYDYYGGLSAGFPELVVSSFKAKELNADWYQLSIDSAEGGDGSLVYEFQFNVLYQGNDGEDHNYLFGLDRQREPIALVKKQTLEDAIAEFEEKRGVEVDEVLVDVSIFDGTKSYQMDNIFEHNVPLLQFILNKLNQNISFGYSNPCTFRNITNGVLYMKYGIAQLEFAGEQF